MKKYLLLLIALLPMLADAKPHTKKMRKRALSKEITYPSKFVRAVRWTDNSGKNVVVMSRTKKAKSASRPEEGYYEQQLEVRHFVFDGKHWRRTWNVHDQVMECDHKMECKYIKKTFAVTDLDEDGVSEVWLMYTTGCGVDERPGVMKIIMYEGEARYTVRGRKRMQINEKKYEGGEYNLDPVFTKAPAAFKEYALDLWKNNTED